MFVPRRVTLPRPQLKYRIAVLPPSCSPQISPIIARLLQVAVPAISFRSKSLVAGYQLASIHDG